MTSATGATLLRSAGDVRTSALELTMATAALRSAMPLVVDVVIVPAHPQAQLGPVLEVSREPRSTGWSRIPRLSAVAASRAQKPIPAKKPRPQEVA